jgi:FkbM family methyltransferase
VVEANSHYGVLTLLLSELVGHAGAVHAFEPQRIVFQALCANLAMNSRANVFASCQAIDERAGTLYAPLVDHDHENNFGAIALRDAPPGEATPAVALDDLALSACHLLRLDAAGREAAALRGAKNTVQRHRPVVYVNTERAASAEELIALLLSLDYKLYWHTPPVFPAANFYRNAENVFPNLVTANILGIPAAAQANIRGLREIAGPESDWRTP